MTIHVATVNVDGQITIPAEIRNLLGIEALDLVTLKVVDETMVLVPLTSEFHEIIGPEQHTDRPLTWKEIEATAFEEHAQHFAREGLETIDD